jgi:hypothetical protein
MSSGFGICGHKNNFNSKVRCGNWVEDVIGSDLSENRPPPPVRMQSEAQANNIDPSLMNNTASIGCPEINDVEISATRNGLASNIMFGHGPKAAIDANAGQNERFATMNQILYNGDKKVKSDVVLQVQKRTAGNEVMTFQPDPESRATREKMKQLARDQRQDSSYLTSTGKMIARASMGAPKHSHSGAFSKSFLPGAYVKRD